MMKPERLLTVEASDPLVGAVTADPALLRLLGYLRLATRPMTVADICSATHLELAAIQRKLDVLEGRGLVEMLPATTRRPSISYRARYAGLKIRCGREEDREIMRTVAGAMQRHATGLLQDEPIPPPPTDAASHHPAFAGVLHLTPPELEELQRRLSNLVEFTEMLGTKYAKRGADPELCNYLISFRIAPLPEPALPFAPVRLVIDGDEAPAPERAAERPAKGQLSARERQAAMALVRGLTIDEVAREMGLARSTVSTMTKRVYRKLGVRRRAEMVTRLREIGLAG